MNQLLFPSMMESLGKAVTTFNDVYFRIPEDRWEDVGDTMERLHTSLIQLNHTLYFDYPFEEGFTADITSYYNLLKEYDEACRQKIEYMFDRPAMFPDDIFAEHQAMFLQEVIERIIENSDFMYNVNKR